MLQADVKLRKESENGQEQLVWEEHNLALTQPEHESLSGIQRKNRLLTC
jgi:hypothetical protein